jgi:hypothetical protein
LGVRQTFDLSSIAEREATLNLPRERAKASVIVAIAIFVAAAGAFFGFVRSPHSQLHLLYGVAVLVIGLLIVFSAWYNFVWRLRRAPNLIVLTDEFLEFGRTDKGTLRQIRWDRPRTQLKLRDMRKAWQSSRKQSTYSMFDLLVGERAVVSLSEQAYHAILQAARDRGMRLEQFEFASVQYTLLHGTRTSR